MMRKIFGIKSISHLIYGLLMLAPILAIGVKCAYVVINKNAKDSYSNSSIIEKTNTISNTGNLVQGKLYDGKVDLSIGNNNTSSSRYRYSQISIDWTDYGAPSGVNFDSFSIYKATTTFYLYLYENDTIAYTIWNGLQTFGNNLTLSIIPSTDITQNGNQIIVWTTNVFQQQKLDNVFYYAIDEIIQDNNFGKINFTSWFDNMMLDNNIQINQTYIHLFNWYLNYTLFISCAYILWLVLMWFVTFARKLLDRGMNYDW